MAKRPMQKAKRGRLRAKGRGRNKKSPRTAPRRATRPGRRLKWVLPSTGIVGRIRAVCAGRTFDEVGEATGVNWETVRRQVHGISKPSIDFVTTLCLAYGVSADWLLLGLGPRRLRR